MSKSVDQLRLGNYSNYYEIRDRENRPTCIAESLPECLKLLNGNGIACDIFMLDIGCNIGKLTQSVRDVIEAALQSQNGQVRALGVDIDGSLIDRAIRNYGTQLLEFAQIDIGAVAHGEVPDNIQQYLREKSIERFDFVCCFSVLMFIHLIRGDDGLRTVLDYICARTKILVLELHSWESYVNQYEMHRQSGEYYEHFDDLQLRGEEKIRQYVISKGFIVVRDAAEKIPPRNRAIEIFFKL
ncbi:probable RNA methyltransferase CG11342 [Armigeres subalbatus]|uniref:probable RNA methyltransferase CG11342 n=1 Tax=Armigeres subalbatus TaxID=124917 RepID=UPI002ECFDBE6